MPSFDPHFRLISSPFYSHRVLAFQRLTLAVYGSITLITSLTYESVVLKQGSIWFSYFTHLSLIGITFYFLFSSYHGFKHQPLPLLPLEQVTNTTTTSFRYPLQRWPGYLQHMHMLLITTITTFPLVVTICYWALIASEDTFATRYNTWAALSLHICNTLFALTEILTTNIPPLLWKHLPFSVLILLSYLAMAYVTHADQHVYTYTFLDIKKQGHMLAAYILGIAIGQIVIFVLVRYIIVLRDRITKVKSNFGLVVSKGTSGNGNGKKGRKNNLKEAEALDDWEQVDWEDTDNVDDGRGGVQRKDTNTTASSSANSSPNPLRKEGGIGDDIMVST